MDDRTEQLVSRIGNKPRGWLLVLAAIGLALTVLGGWLVTPTLAFKSPEYYQTNPTFDLAITKSSVPQFFSKTGTNRYVINVSRTNTDTVAAGVSVYDAMPEGVSATIDSAEDWACTVTNQRIVNCSYTKAIPDDLLSFPPIIINVNLSSLVTETQVTNTAQILITDANSSNNFSTITTLIDPVDLEISKSHLPDQEIIGDINTDITYIITVKNNGPVTATNIIITDTLSPYINFISFTGVNIPTYTLSDNKLVWSVDKLALGDSKTFEILSDLKYTAEGKIVTNLVETISEVSADWNVDNNKDETSFVVGGLDIEKSVEDLEIPYSAYVGEPITFTIQVTNTSTDSEKDGISLTDLFSDSFDIDLEKSNELTKELYDPSTVAPTLVADPSNPRLIKSTFNLTEGETKTVKILARPNNSVTAQTTITNTAKVSWQKLVITSNEVELDVIPAAAILVSKSDGVNSVFPGEFLTYTISVKNIGSRYMGAGLDIEDKLPNFTTIDAILRDTLPSNSEIIIEYPYVRTKINQELEPDDEISFRIKVLVVSNIPVPSTLTNTVSIDTPDGFYNGNTETTDIDLTGVILPVSSGMDITLSVSPAQAKTGESLTFRINVLNSGNTQTNNAIVSGTMVSVLDYVSNTPATGTSFSANATARTYSWSVGNLLPGQSRSLLMVWKVNSSVTASNTYSHVSTLTWNSSKSLVSNTVKFRVTPTSTLPGTGFGAAEQQPSSGLGTAAIILSTILGLLGAGSLAYSVYAKKNQPLWANWFLVAGVILFCGGALFGVAAWGFQSIPTQKPQQVSAINHVTQAPGSATSNQAKPTDFVEIWDSWPTPTPQSLPDYAIPTPPADLDQGPNGNEADSSPMTRILIPNMGLDTVVKYVPYDGSSWLIGGLKQEVAWMGDTSWPGLGGNTGLAGHVDLANGDSGPFWNLADLKPGDQITVWTEMNKYIYQMREFRIVGDSDLSVIEPTEQPQLTLITCAGWDADLRLYLERMVVFADLVRVEPLHTSARGN